MQMQPERRPEGAATKAPRTRGASAISPILQHVEHFQRRVLVDALLDAWGPQWERRAEAFEAARPRPGDYVGRATREELSAQWQRLTEIAQACRARAWLSPLDLVTEDVDSVLGRWPRCPVDR